MLKVEILPIQDTLVLRARGSELLIMGPHIVELKSKKKPQDFSSYFMSEALINRPARKLFEAWLRKDRNLWPRIYKAVHEEMEIKQEEAEEAKAAPKKKEVEEEPKASKKAATEKKAPEAKKTEPKKAVKDTPKKAKKTPAKKAASKAVKKASTKTAKKSTAKKPATKKAKTKGKG